MKREEFNTLTNEDIIYSSYLKFTRLVNKIIILFIPYFRRFYRFLALPYCYFKIVNWEECSASRYQVVKDFLYIFFRLKYFPDNYSLCRLWEKDRSTWKYYYGSIYDPYQRGRLRKEVQRKEYQVLFEDKYVCYQLCKAANLPLPIQYAYIEPNNDYKSIILSILKRSPRKKIIIKPVKGKGGRGIILVYYDGNQVIAHSLSIATSLADFKLESNSVVQEYLIQHDDLSRFSTSTNTVRIITMFTKSGESIIIGAEMRFGVNDAFVDNTSAGGVAAGIDLNTGILYDVAYDSSSRMHFHHPTTDFKFKDFKIPFWQETVNLAKKTQQVFFYYKLLGQDIAITTEGPVIIEINSAHDNVGTEQTYGPFLFNPKVLNEFKRYKLLVNNML